MLRPMSLLCATTVLAMSLATPGPAIGAPTLAVSFSNTTGTFGSGPDVMIGWRFSTTGPISVSQLGFWDHQGDGLGESHPVGIWTTGGLGTSAAALVTATVSAGTASPLAGSSFRMVDVTPITLPAGDYVIGGLLRSQQVDSYKETTGVSGFAAAPGITYVERRFIGAFSGLSRPEGTAAGLGSFGPNFTFEVVPEPSSVAVATFFGLAGLTGRGLRRRQPSR